MVVSTTSEMTPEASRRASLLQSGWIQAAVLCLVLAIIHTWPLAAAPATWSRNDNGDTMLNEWTLAWVEHQLPRMPHRLFQANIFFPSRDALAFSEPLIVPAILGAPIAWLGGSPVLVFNLVLIAGFALTALSAYCLVVRWTGDRVAGMLGATIFAFNSHTLTRLPHVQAMHLYGLPLALVATDRLLISARRRDGLWLAVWLAILAYTSGYLVVFGIVMVAVATMARAGDGLTDHLRVATAFAIAVAGTAAMVIPLSLPYVRVARTEHMVRSLGEASIYSATATSYIAAAGTFHLRWSGHLFNQPVDPLFPGVLAFLFAAVALTSVAKRSRENLLSGRRVWMLAAIGAAGVILSLGTHTPIYGWVYRIFPPLQGLRAPSRFGNLFLLAVAGLAGFGLAAMRTRFAGTRWIGAVSIALVIVANLEALRAPFQFTRFEGIPSIYSIVRDAPGPVVLTEIPFYQPFAIFKNADYVLASTAHWRPLMNGYSGYVPESYVRYAREFASFPSDEAIRAMRDVGVTHVMVHLARVAGDPVDFAARLDACQDLELLAVAHGNLRLYRFR